ncbi:MAG: hypothetical protein IIX13_09505 [Bacteroidales bacterium]|nr:hypothetical protein [Bacteroidales bacterium]
MANNGWIKLNRDILTDETWLKKPFSEGQALVDLALMATYTARDVTIRGETVHLEPGDVVRSQAQLAERWGWSRGKVRRFIERHEWTEKAAQKPAQQKAQKAAQKRTVIRVDISRLSGIGRPENGQKNGPTKSPKTDTYKKYKESYIQEVEEVDARAREGQARGGTNRPINVNTKAITSAPRSTPTTPTLTELHSFCSEHDLHVNVERFAEYYGSRGWKTSTGKPVTNWKRKLCDWSDADGENWKEEQRRKAAVEKGRREQAEREAKLEEEYQKELEKWRAEKGRDAPKSIEELKNAVLKEI